MSCQHGCTSQNRRMTGSCGQEALDRVSRGSGGLVRCIQEALQFEHLGVRRGGVMALLRSLDGEKEEGEDGEHEEEGGPAPRAEGEERKRRCMRRAREDSPRPRLASGLV